MNTRVAVGGARGRSRRSFPAYGPVDAVVSYAAFYVFVTRATLTIVEVFTGAVPDLVPSMVRLGLAALLWFVLVVTVLDQVRRQLAALGVLDDDTRRPSLFGASSLSVAASTVAVFVGGAIAAVTFEPAVRAGISIVRAVGTVDAASVVPFDIVAMVVFFVSFAAATRSLDRLVVGGVRRLIGG